MQAASFRLGLPSLTAFALAAFVACGTFSGDGETAAPNQRDGSANPTTSVVTIDGSLVDGATNDGAMTGDASVLHDGNVGPGNDAAPACNKPCGAHGHCAIMREPAGEACLCDAGYYATLQGCAPITTGTACDGVSCGPHGGCFAGPPYNLPTCQCFGDYVPYGRGCARVDKIRCVDRDGSLKDKGSIRCSDNDGAYEVCRDGNGDGVLEWVASGTPSCAAGSTCSACIGGKCNAGDGTGGEPCPTGTVCMSKVHEMDVYRCMPSCDCSNCGTCNPDQFSGYQRSCGSTSDSFDQATVACSNPCARSNEGCLPYGAFAFCFPMEGCASGPPQ